MVCHVWVGMKKEYRYSITDIVQFVINIKIKKLLWGDKL